MPCDAIAYGWAQVSEPALLKLLDLETAQAVLVAFLKERFKCEVRVKKDVLNNVLQITCENLTLTYSDGAVKIVASQGWLSSQLKMLTQASVQSLRAAALLKLKIRVGNAIKAKGGKVLAMQEAKGGTLLKVEL